MLQLSTEDHESMLNANLSKQEGNPSVNIKCKETAVSMQIKHTKQMEPISTDKYYISTGSVE